jgi:tRNA (guanine37-N1)-methyltransferase
VIYVRPMEKRLQKMANTMSFVWKHYLCGHYKGDQRVLIILLPKKFIGDYVLSGGELLVSRIIVGCFNSVDSWCVERWNSASMIAFKMALLSELFTQWPRLQRKVPEVLTSGNLPKFDQWRDGAWAYYN